MLYKLKNYYINRSNMIEKKNKRFDRKERNRGADLLNSLQRGGRDSSINAPFHGPIG